MEQFDLLIQQLTLRLNDCAEPKIPFTEGYKMAIEHALVLAKIYRGSAAFAQKLESTLQASDEKLAARMHALEIA
jgi:hypothetical protein